MSAACWVAVSGCRGFAWAGAGSLISQVLQTVDVEGSGFRILSIQLSLVRAPHFSCCPLVWQAWPFVRIYFL